MAETLPVHPVEYSETDGLPMPDADYQGETLYYAVPALKAWFAKRPDVYASGDLFTYLEEGNADNHMAPDVFVVFGAASHQRETYKLWEEPGGVPDFVLEILSPSTWRKDLGEKRALYASLGVGEYWLYDPRGRFMQPTLAGHRLIGGSYVPLPATESPGGRSIRSPVLGLDLRLAEERLRFFDPVTARYLPDMAESWEESRISERERRTLETRARASEARAGALEAKLDTAESDLDAARARIAELERALGDNTKD